MSDVRMEPDVAAPIISRFENLRDVLDNIQVTVVGHAGAIERACGEFGTSVSHGTEAYHIGWRESLHVTGDSAGIIAGNTNVFEIELTRMDQDLATIPGIGPGRP